MTLRGYKSFMKKARFLLISLCVALCFGIIYSASAEAPLSAKQLLLAQLQSPGSSLYNDLYKTSSGTASYEVKALSGMLINVESLKTLTGAKLKLNYKVDSPKKKVEANYDLSLNKKNFKGNLFIDNNKIILSREVLALIKEMDPNFDMGGGKDLPQYAYFTDDQFKKMWDAVIKSKGQSIPPEFKELLIYIVEAIPDKYFTTSLTNQKLSFSIDQRGLEDVIFSVLQKVKNDKDRFATLVANIVAASDSTKSPQEIKKEILKGLEETINNDRFPNSPEAVQKLLAGAINLKELTYETSLLPAGQNKFIMVLDFGGESALTGTVTINVDSTVGKDNVNGAYDINVIARETKKGIKVDGHISGKFKQDLVNATSDGLIKVNAGDISGNDTLLDFALQVSSEAKVDKDVQANIPVLTGLNSINLTQYMQQSPKVKVIVDGKPVVFDVAPFVQDGKHTIVPLRNLAEALGCEVTWVEPDQINISLGDISITMYVNKQTYTVNGIEKQLDVPPFIKNGKRTMVPLRVIAEELGCQVEFSSQTNTVYINRTRDQ